MIDQPSAAVLLALAADQVDLLSRRPAEEPLNDADRYSLRVAASLIKTAARDTHDAPARRTEMITHVRAALEVLGHGPQDEPGDLEQEARRLDLALRDVVLQSDDGEATARALSTDRQGFHQHLLAVVRERLDVNRPGYGTL